MNFNERAKTWDTPSKIEMAKRNSSEISLLASNTNTALEFGCGTGLITFNLLDKFKNFILLDTSEEMLKVADSKIKNAKLDNITTKLHNLLENPLDFQVNTIYTAMALHHVDDVQLILKRFFDSLTPHGELLIVDLNEDNGVFHREAKNFTGHNGFSQEKLQQLALDAGFKTVASHTFFEGLKDKDDSSSIFSLFLLKAIK